MRNGGASYYGLIAELYDTGVGEDPKGDLAYYRDAITSLPGPALDLACGTGRLLIPYHQAGLDVEGADSSPEMLAICRRKAAEAGLSPVLHQQLMQELELP